MIAGVVESDWVVSLATEVDTGGLDCDISSVDVCEADVDSDVVLMITTEEGLDVVDTPVEEVDSVDALLVAGDEELDVAG